MKIAACYSGLGSRLIHDKNSLKDQLVKLSSKPLDLFFNFWTDGISKETLNKIIQDIILEIGNDINLVCLETKESPKINFKYNVKDLWSMGNKPHAIYGMYESIRNADKLRQQHEKFINEEYDIVIRSRPDIKIDKALDYEVIDQILKTESMTIFPKSHNWFDAWNDSGGMLNDQFFISISKLMTEITSLDVNLCCDEGCRFHPESILWWRIVKQLSLPDYLLDKDIPWYKFLNFVTINRWGIEMTTPASNFEQQNIEKFNLDKILKSFDFEYNVSS